MRVLIVDDSHSMRAFIAGVLEAAFGAVVQEARNGFEALKALPGAACDLIVADVNMPDINGLELLRYVKDHPIYRRLPVIVISTEIDPEDRKRGLQAGAAAYLGKPFEPCDLEAAVHQVLHPEQARP